MLALKLYLEMESIQYTDWEVA